MPSLGPPTVAVDRPDEFTIIGRYFAPLAAGSVDALALADDAALLSAPPGRTVVVTVDTLIEGVHFRADDPAGSLAAKLIGVNLSDLAAMAAVPSGYLLALSLPRAWTASALIAWLDGFAAGLAAEQRRFGIHLLGGDTVATPGPLTLTLTAFGHVAPGGELRRSTARLGDEVYVSGTIGDAFVGLALLDGRICGLSEDERAHAIDRYRRPRPRVALGIALSGVAHAAADVSDGLVADLAQICRASGVSATLEAASIPLSPAGRRAIAAGTVSLAELISGGDDYELVFTASLTAAALATTSERTGVALTRIGRIGDIGDAIDRTMPVAVRDGTGRPLDVGQGGYRHLR